MNIIYYTMQTLAAVVETLPIGTNLALYQFLWMLVSGALLASRGALFPALQAIGLGAAEVRRAWAAFRYGAWSVNYHHQRWWLGMVHLKGALLLGHLDSLTIHGLAKFALLPLWLICISR